MGDRWRLVYDDDNEVGVLQLGEQDVELHFDSRVDAENGMHYLNGALDALADTQAKLETLQEAACSAVCVLAEHIEEPLRAALEATAPEGCEATQRGGGHVPVGGTVGMEPPPPPPRSDTMPPRRRAPKGGDA